MKTIKTLSFASFAIIIGYSIQGIINGARLAQLAIILFVMSVVCVPAAISVIHNRKN